uniref:Uncharacterized protein n=1 Tax=Anguilla anguilla TaxID=7936 RepID=A0A0E9TXK4_ANGAN
MSRGFTFQGEML